MTILNTFEIDNLTLGATWELWQPIFTWLGIAGIMIAVAFFLTRFLKASNKYVYTLRNNRARTNARRGHTSWNAYIQSKPYLLENARKANSSSGEAAIHSVGSDIIDIHINTSAHA